MSLHQAKNTTCSFFGIRQVTLDRIWFVIATVTGPTSCPLAAAIFAPRGDASSYFRAPGVERMKIEI
jgi:hypothetical protein